MYVQREVTSINGPVLLDINHVTLCCTCFLNISPHNPITKFHVTLQSIIHHVLFNVLIFLSM